MKKILAALFFFIINIIWISNDNTLPAIGDDARWLYETAILTEKVQNEDLTSIYSKWQTMFIKDTNSFPRTPLFTLLSVPTFLAFGVNEDYALITNAFILFLSSILLGLLVDEIFKFNKYRKEISILSIILFNLMPGVYGLSRLYMSEILQVFFVVLIALIYVKNKDRLSYLIYFELGVVLALAMLLRFLMPMYLIIPTIYFVIWQLKLKEKPIKYLLSLIILLIPFILLSLTWYGPNLNTYIEFSKYTSTGELAEITSLGPVFSISTILKFWYVIATWHFGLPIILLIAFLILAQIIRIFSKDIYISIAKKKLIDTIKAKFILTNTRNSYNEILFLALSFIPALILNTLSVNKTARYFFPVEFFLIIIIAYLSIITIKEGNKLFKLITLFLIALSFYPITQSIIPNLKALPYTNLMYTSNTYLREDSDKEKYEYVLNILKENKDRTIYTIAETVDFNDAQLIWYSFLNGLKINTVGEFSLYTTIDEGISKVNNSNLIIVQYNIAINDKYKDKYIDIIKYVEDSNFTLFNSKEFKDGVLIKIFLK